MSYLLDHSIIQNFCQINEGPINLSISINTFLHDKQIFIKRVAYTTLFMATCDAMEIGSAQAFWIDDVRCISFTTDANGDIKSFALSACYIQ